LGPGGACRAARRGGQIDVRLDVARQGLLQRAAEVSQPLVAVLKLVDDDGRPVAIATGEGDTVDNAVADIVRPVDRRAGVGHLDHALAQIDLGQPIVETLKREQAVETVGVAAAVDQGRLLMDVRQERLIRQADHPFEYTGRPHATHRNDGLSGVPVPDWRGPSCRCP